MHANLLVFSAMLLTAWVVRIWLSNRQLVHYQRQVRAMSAPGRGFVGSGRSYRRGGGAGAIAIISTDADGLIQRATVMRGRTVFAAFHDLDALRGVPVSRLIEGEGVAATTHRGTADALRQAAEAVARTMAQIPDVPEHASVGG
jgi:DNA-binding transcriptional regulator of glucitol operon